MQSAVWLSSLRTDWLFQCIESKLGGAHEDTLMEFPGHCLESEIGGGSRFHPSHTTVPTDPHTEVRRMYAAERYCREARPTRSKKAFSSASERAGLSLSLPGAGRSAGSLFHQVLVDAEAAQRRELGASALPLPPDDGAARRLIHGSR